MAVPRPTYVPNNAAISTGDIVTRTQQVDANGALLGTSSLTELTVAAGTSTQTGAARTAGVGSALFLFLDITASPNNAETLTVSVQGQDPASTKWVTAAAFTAVVASNVGATPTAATFMFVADPVQPAVALTANTGGRQIVQARVPRTWRAVVAHSSTGAWTYTLGWSVAGA